MNPFRQRIGIFYEDPAWAIELFDALVQSFKYADCVSHIYKSSKEIVLSSGDIIKFIPCNDFVKGHRFTSAYIQNKNLNEKREYIFCCIYPTLTLNQNSECYIINGFSDLVKSNTLLQSVRSFFFSQAESQDDNAIDLEKIISESENL